MLPIPAVLVRGGSSRGLLIKEEDVSGLDHAEQLSLFARMVGSPDPGRRQVDGVGGGNATTSKVAVISASRDSAHDIDYAFHQIIVETGHSERRGTCGNLIAAAAQFAIHEGYVTARAPLTVVRVFDVNTGQSISVEVPVSGSAVQYSGDVAIDGVPGTGAGVVVNFMAPAGRVTGSMLPTGNLVDTIEINGSLLTVSLVDVVNPVVLVHASSLDPTLSWSLGDLEAHPTLPLLLEKVRARAAVKFGLASSVAAVAAESPMRPFVGVFADVTMANLAPSAAIPTGANAKVRMYSGGDLHRALPLSAGLATAALVTLRSDQANGIRGASTSTIRLEHPSGALDCIVHSDDGVGATPADEAEQGASLPRAVSAVAVTLTGRRIMSGTLEFED